MTKIEKICGIVREQGLRWVAQRVFLEAQKRVGWEARQHPPRAWGADEWRQWVAPRWQASTPAELLHAWREGAGAAWGRARTEPAWREAYAGLLSGPKRAALLAAAERILAGKFHLFSRQEVAVGFPPPWLCNPALGPQAAPPAAVHWSKVPMRGAAYGDLKYVWELSRFAWAYPLARAFAATGDERYAEGFWRLWLDWIERNPPHATVQWKCGQECGLRLMAVAFAVQVLRSAAATTPERFARHLGAVGALADRVARGGWYAHLQNNNHSMSEAAGIYTVGVMFPELRDAARWRKQGWRELAGEALRLVRADGTFVQKSHNYHRLMLQDYLWARSAAATVGDTWPAPVEARLQAAADYLRAVVDPVAGEAPNFGANDGALILPLSDAPYTDFRPVLAASHYAAHQRRLPSTQGVGDEDLLWLFGPAALSAPPEPSQPPPALQADIGGLYTLRQDDAEAWAFMHAENYQDRPGQPDQLHVDLWWRGLNLARDSGSYLYYGPPDLCAWIPSTAMHNTVMVDGCEQMERGPRFLWVTWARAQVVERRAAGGGLGAGLVAKHDGYERLPGRVGHRRGVLAAGRGRWLVWDEITGEGAHDARLHWLLGDWPWRAGGAAGDITLQTPQGEYHVAVRSQAAGAFAVHRAAEGPEPWGWESRHYGDRSPALSLTLATAGPLPRRFLTIFSPEPFTWLGAAGEFPAGAAWSDGELTWPAASSGPWALANIGWTARR